MTATPLRAWAHRWRLASPHVMSAVMAVLNGWFTGECFRSLGVGASYRDGWGSAIKSLTHGLSSWPDGEGEAWRKLFAAIGFNGAPPDFHLSIEDFWEPRLETWQELVGRVEEHLARQLEQYRKECEHHCELHGSKKVPRPKARHHLSWLMQHRICGMRCEEIADRYAEENSQLERSPSVGAVAKAIRRTAAMIELE